MLDQRDILTSKRVLALGRTGTGKSEAAKWLTRGWHNLIAYDERGGLDLPNAKVVTKLSELGKCRTGRYIFRPEKRLLDDPEVTAAMLSRFFGWIYKRQDTCLFIDEIEDVMMGGRTDRDADPNLRHILKRGRKFNISVVACTQRPANIPIMFYSESDVFMVFKLLFKDDRKRVEGWTGELPWQDQGKYQFFLHDIHSDAGPLLTKIKLET